MNSLKLIVAESIDSIDEQNEIFWCFFFQSLYSEQMESKSTRKAQVVVLRLSCVLLKREAVDCVIF